MHIKVITTSTSTIGYIKHSKEIEVIPEVIKYSENEEYQDFYDVSSENFYNRLAYDKYASPRVTPNKVTYIKAVVDKAIEDGYDEFLFVLPSSDIIDYKTNIEIAMQKTKLKYEVVDTRLIGYPLAYLAKEAQRMINAGATLNECKEGILDIARGIGILLYIYDKEPLIPLEADLKSLGSDTLDKKGRLYSLENGKLVQIKLEKTRPTVYSMLEHFSRLVEGCETTPFILFTGNNSYKRVLDYNIHLIYKRLDKIKTIPLPSVLGTRLGNNIIALGYIKR